jgi:hypothetical protein
VRVAGDGKNRSHAIRSTPAEGEKNVSHVVRSPDNNIYLRIPHRLLSPVSGLVQESISNNHMQKGIMAQETIGSETG